MEITHHGNRFHFAYRLQGMVGSMSRMPTFRRKFKNLVKLLYLEALQAGILASQDAEGSQSRRNGQGPVSTTGSKCTAVTQKEKPQVSEDVV